MKIAVMGSKEFANRVKNIIKQEHHDVDVTMFCYDRYIEIVDFLIENQQKFDGILFPGHVSYLYAEKVIKQETLWEYIPINTGSFYRALLETYVQGNDIYNISIDTYKSDFVMEAYDEIGIKRDETNLIFVSEASEDADYYYYLLEFHRKNYYSGKAKCCITGVSEVWQKLLEDGIPCVRTKPTSHVVLDTYNKLYIKHIGLAEVNADIAVMTVHIDLPSRYSLSIQEDYEQLLSRFELAKQINKLALRVNGAVIENTDRDFWIITDRKTLEVETNNLENIYFSNLFSDVYRHGLSVGIGFGKNAADAKRHAYMAVCRATKSRENVAFAVYNTEHIKGPIKISTIKNYNNPNDTVDKLHKLGLGNSSANKIATILEENEKNEFTSKELADMCGMSKRNMDRIIQKLEDAECCRIIYEKRSDKAGRPARIIEFNLK